jgi:hypothetical protein
MSDRERDDEIARRARAALDRSADELDAATQTRLRAARRAALDALDAPPSVWPRRALLSASAAGLLFGVSWWLRTPALPVALDDDLDDVEILAGADDLELYDDLEFYRWLDDDDDEPI